MMIRQNYKVYKALAEDITMPYTWVSNPPKPRRIARITNHETGKTIFCKLLEIDKSFRNRYNSKDRCPLSSTDHVIVLNGWYRKRLEIEKTGNEFKTNLEINQEAYERWVFSFYAEIRAALAHPDYNVKLAVILGIIGLMLGIISLIITFYPLVPKLYILLKAVL
jgi:hypothetical protein